MKRPILGLLAAAILGVGLVGAPAGAATPNQATSMATPAHDHGHHDDGDYHAHRHHPRHDDGDDDGHHHGRGRCQALVAICLL